MPPLKIAITLFRMMDKRRVFMRGFRLTLPLVSGVIPFGVLYATLAVAAGFPGWLTLLFSVAVFGGSSQLVFIDLFLHLGSALQAALGSNIVNARHLIYSAGVSARVSQFSKPWRILLSYLLTDQLYAISQAREEELASIPLPLAPWFYFGSGACTWIFWILSTGCGIAFGALVPATWNLSFSVPLIFMPLLFAVAKSRYGYLAALLALVLVYVLRDLPLGLGVFSAILIASYLAFVTEKYRKKR